MPDRLRHLNGNPDQAFGFYPSEGAVVKKSTGIANADLRERTAGISLVPE